MNKGEETIFTLDKPIMNFRHRYRKSLQLLVFLVFVLYMGLLLYHSFSGTNNTISEVS